MTELPEPDDEATAETEALEGADEPERGGRPKGARNQPDFQLSAVHALQRARKSTSGDAEVTPRATLLVGSAVAWALLDLAEAVRSHGEKDTSEGDVEEA